MQDKDDFMISVVVPVYKEEKNISPFLDRLIAVMNKNSYRYEVLFCLDPSPDRTYEVIQDHIQTNPSIKLIQFSRRFGQPAATMAGILNCRGDVCVAIDVDLQDPPELIADMVEKWKEGNDVVYAQRTTRDGETFIKKLICKVGYKVINKLGEVEIPVNTGDFRLMNRRVIEELRKLNEHHGFLRGLVAFVGFKQVPILYKRDSRYSGKGNYNRFLGSLRIGLNGLICFSSKPLSIMTGTGIFFSVAGVLMGIWRLIDKVILKMNLTPALTLTVIAVTFFAGVQLFFMGLLGEYIGRIYDEVKRRPMYIIDKKENMEE